MLIQSYSQKRQEIQKLDRWVVLELTNKTLSRWNLVQTSLPCHHTVQIVNILTSLHISVYIQWLNTSIMLIKWLSLCCSFSKLNANSNLSFKSFWTYVHVQLPVHVCFVHFCMFWYFPQLCQLHRHSDDRWNGRGDGTEGWRPLARRGREWPVPAL